MRNRLFCTLFLSVDSIIPAMIAILQYHHPPPPSLLLMKCSLIELHTNK